VPIQPGKTWKRRFRHPQLLHSQPQLLLVNSFETGSNGTAISTANSGGSGQNAFDVVSATNATVAFSSTQAAHGSLSCEFATGSTAADWAVEWTTSLGGAPWPQLYFRLYLYFTANPSAAYRIFALNNAGGVCAAIELNTTGTLRFNNSSGSQILATTASIPLGQWFRVEGFVIGSTANGQVSITLFDSMDSTTATEGPDTSTATQATSGPMTQAVYGNIGATAANVGPYWMDDIGLSSTGYLGPVASAPVAVSDIDSGYASDASQVTAYPAATDVSQGSDSGLVSAYPADTDASQALDGNAQAGVANTDACQASDGPVGWSLVQQSAVETTATATKTLPNASTAGTLLIATIGAGSAVAITPPAGWTQVVPASNGTNESYIFAYYDNPGGLSSFTFSGAAGTCIGEVSEWSCAVVAEVFTASDTGAATAGAVASVTTDTSGTAQPGDLAVAVALEHLTTASAITWTGPSGYTPFAGLVVTSAVNHMYAGYSPSLPSGGVQAVTVTSSVSAVGASGWTGVVATFSPVGGAAPVAVSDTDACQGLDSNGQISAGDIDASSAADAGEQVSPAGGDASQAADAAAVAAHLTGSDASSVTDASGLAAYVSSSDVSSAADAALVSGQLVSSADAGAASDSSGLTAHVTASDLASAAEASFLAASLSAADASVAADSSGLTAYVTASDGGQASEGASTASGASSPDFSQAADSSGLTGYPSANDTASASEASFITATASTTDAARAADTSGLTAQPASSDSCGAADSSGLTATVPAADISRASDASGVPPASLGSADSSQAGETTFITAYLGSSDSCQAAEASNDPEATFVADTDTCHGEDSGISFPLTGDNTVASESSAVTAASLSSAEVCQGLDAAVPASGTWLIASSDSCQASESSWSAWPASPDSCQAADGGEHVTVPGAAIADADAASAAEGPVPEAVAVEAWAAVYSPVRGWYREVAPSAEPVGEPEPVRRVAAAVSVSAGRALAVSVSVRVRA